MEEMILRLMAWERAKGELNSMLQTYVNNSDKFHVLKDAIQSFINDVEGNSKHQ